MSRHVRRWAGIAMIVLAGTASAVAAKAPSAPQGDVAAPAVGPEQTVPEAPEPDAWPYQPGVSVLRVGQDYTQAATETSREVGVIMGSAEIAGHVSGDVWVVLGDVRVLSTAVIEGSLVVTGGGATVAPGARLRRDLVVIGGGYDAPADFTPGGESVVIGARSLGGRFAAIVPWFTRGLLWGRLIVPNLWWIWSIVGAIFLIGLALNVILAGSVRSCAATLQEKPLTSFMTGLLVLLLTGPVCLLLAMSVVGIAVIPFVLCALVIAAIVGRVGVAQWIGLGMLRRRADESAGRAVAAFVVGFLLLIVAYMIPLLGIATWTMVGVFGLGAASLAFVSAYRQERPAAPEGVGESGPPPAPIAPERTYETAPAAARGVHEPVPPSSDLAAFPHASLRDRVAAAFLDLILVVLCAQALDVFNRRADDSFLFLLVAYHIGFVAWKGTTIGGIICQLRVTKVDGTPMRFVDSLVRGLSAIFSAVVVGLGFLWIVKDPERQAWHDRIAGTYVVRVPRNWPI